MDMVTNEQHEAEMYDTEFSDCELHPTDDDGEYENEYACPVCDSHALQYVMHYPVGADDATTELYQCGDCGAHGEADDCRVPAPAIALPARRPIAAAAARPLPLQEVA
jgi:hypothetical protein